MIRHILPFNTIQPIFALSSRLLKWEVWKDLAKEFSEVISSTSTMASSVPKIALNNGECIPIVGLGTWRSKPGEVTQAVVDAIDCGYRHIDCALIYGNEAEIGAALQKKFSDGSVKREDLFITSKLWNTFHSKDLVLPAIKTSLKNLSLDYLDLYLIHCPMGYKEGGALIPTDEDGKVMFSEVDYLETWKALEECVDLGLTRSIGVSNFNKAQIERILSIARIPPANNQVECHPYLIQRKLLDYCKSKGITITAYSPLGSPDRPWAKPEDPQLLDDPKIKALADKYNRTPAQILIKYQVKRGVSVIPKSVTKSRIESNFKLFDFELSDNDVAAIDSFDCNGRLCHLNWVNHHPHFPFYDEF